MATDAIVAATVDHAVSTASVDPDAPREPRDERCRFDADALAAVMRLCDSAKNRDRVLDAADQALQRAVADLDSDRTLVCVMLRERITAGTAQRQVVVENLQGDVGTGRREDPT